MKDAAFLDYYQIPFLEIVRDLKKEGNQRVEPSSIRTEFWSGIPGGEYQGNDARQFLSNYLSVLESSLQGMISPHSIAYFLHAYRRLQPAPIGRNRNPTSVIYTRGVFEAAVQKYAKRSLCRGMATSTECKESEILSGMLMRPKFKFILKMLKAGPQLVLTKFGKAQMAELFEIERRAYEVWKTAATMRALAKGVTILVGVEGAQKVPGTFPDVISPALHWGVRSTVEQTP